MGLPCRPMLVVLDRRVMIKLFLVIGLFFAPQAYSSSQNCDSMLQSKRAEEKFNSLPPYETEYMSGYKEVKNPSDPFSWLNFDSEIKRIPLGHVALLIQTPANSSARTYVEGYVYKIEPDPTRRIKLEDYLRTLTPVERESFLAKNRVAFDSIVFLGYRLFITRNPPRLTEAGEIIGWRRAPRTLRVVPIETIVAAKYLLPGKSHP